MNRKIFFAFLALAFVAYLSSCSKEYSLESGKTVVPASGTLKDSSGNCLPSIVHGTFYNGVLPGSDTAYIELQVSVTNAGSYSIRTDLQNGFMFADSGFFNTTGINTILLKPIGTPILPILSSFSVSFDSSVCTFSVNVQDSTGTGLGGGTGGGGTDSLTVGTWQFFTDSSTFNGTIDTSYALDTLGFRYQFLAGHTLGTDSLFYIFVSFPGGVITPGSFDIQAAFPQFNGFELNDPLDNPIYVNITDPTSSNAGTVIVDSYNSTTRLMTGRFSGLTNDASGNAVIPVTNGTFSVVISP
ncbi:MAG TPA: hypothetical protein PKM63_00670 [Panacibacter sp.]|nr:hypothetical protein [Panacibacter sp.]HNP42764.1 hypothetical protein [Panacibacter sp.]